MKPLSSLITTILIAAILLSINVIAGGSFGFTEHPNKYCARVKDGKTIIVHEGDTLITGVTLNNGTKILPDGTIVKKDGSILTLHQGECIDKNGNIKAEKFNKKK